MDPTPVGTFLRNYHPGRGSDMHLEVSKNEGWNAHEILVYSWNISAANHTRVIVGNPSTSGTLHST